MPQFHFKKKGNEEPPRPDEKVNIGTARNPPGAVEAKMLYLRGEGLLTYT